MQTTYGEWHKVRINRCLVNEVGNILNITLSQNISLDKILKEFRMGQAMKEVLSCKSRRSIEL